MSSELGKRRRTMTQRGKEYNKSMQKVMDEEVKEDSVDVKDEDTVQVKDDSVVEETEENVVEIIVESDTEERTEIICSTEEMNEVNEFASEKGSVSTLNESMNNSVATSNESMSGEENEMADGTIHPTDNDNDTTKTMEIYSEEMLVDDVTCNGCKVVDELKSRCISMQSVIDKLSENIGFMNEEDVLYLSRKK